MYDTQILLFLMLIMIKLPPISTKNKRDYINKQLINEAGLKNLMQCAKMNIIYFFRVGVC